MWPERVRRQGEGPKSQFEWVRKWEIVERQKGKYLGEFPFYGLEKFPRVSASPAAPRAPEDVEAVCEMCWMFAGRRSRLCYRGSKLSLQASRYIESSRKRI